MSNTLKQKLKNKEVTIGSWLTIGSEVTTEIMANSGYNWLAIDMEHSAIDIATAQKMIRIVDLCGVAPLVRVGSNSSEAIKRVMDAGAHGVIVPMVNSAEDARHAVGASKYPPVGFRGVGLARAQKYGLGFNEYKEWATQNSVVIVQIEHVKAVENIREIMKQEGVDGFLVGPYDLSASMGLPGEFDHPKVKEALEEVKKVSGEMDLVSGFHVIQPDVAELNKKKQEGYKFISFSLDTLFLAKNCKLER